MIACSRPWFIQRHIQPKPATTIRISIRRGRHNYYF
jgi:hypothetical protein